MRLFSIISFIIVCASCRGPDPAITLRVKERKISVNGKTASVYCIEQLDGTFGFSAQKGQEITIDLKNEISFPTSIHWHGLLLPNDQDGVAFITQFPVYPNETYRYHFPLKQAGSFWMHAHYYLEQQRLLSAPLILKESRDSEVADQDIVLFLADFSFKDPVQIMEELMCPSHTGEMKMSSHEHGHLVEVAYDAFLANWRTLEDPEIKRVQSNSTVRLRIINGSSATNFFIFTGALQGEAIAVDGNRIQPLLGDKFELAIAQRIDLIVRIPKEGGTFPILAQGEGTSMQTGIVLATEPTTLPKLVGNTQTIGALVNQQEELFCALDPLPQRAIDREITMELGGTMLPYRWTINGQAWPNITPLLVKKGERVRVTFKNTSSMSHPMHLHGHTFQITNINGKKIRGALRDTVLVLPNTTVSMEFDADNPGVWPFHCHLLYHQESGMMTLLSYEL